MSDAVARRREVAVAGHRNDRGVAKQGLSDPSPDVRSTALGALDRIGALTIAELRTGLLDTDSRVRRRAVEIAARFSEADLGPMLEDNDPSVVEAAAWACGERESTTASVLDALMGIASQHDDALCRESAVAALGAIGNERGLDCILAALKDKAPVRRRAVLALAPFSGTHVDDALSAALLDRDWQVRQAAEDLLA